MRAEALKGHLDLLLLTVVADGPRHGYGVIEELRRRTGDALTLPEGTVYPALHRLEVAGLLRSRWSDAGGRRRRVYTLTRKGAGAVESKRVEWDAFARTMDAVLKGEPWPSTA
jgi:DNA-binding PadR family transcriptional regulator